MSEERIRVEIEKVTEGMVGSCAVGGSAFVSMTYPEDGIVVRSLSPGQISVYLSQSVLDAIENMEEGQVKEVDSWSI